MVDLKVQFQEQPGPDSLHSLGAWSWRDPSAVGGIGQEKGVSGKCIEGVKYMLLESCILLAVF